MPDIAAVCGAKRHDFSADAEFAACLADEDHAIPDERHGSQVFADGGVYERAVPKQRAVDCIERDEVTVGRAAEQPTAGNCGSPVAARGIRNGGMRDSSTASGRSPRR